MQKNFIQKSKRLLILLILGDLFFVALHIILEIPHYTNYPAILELPYYHSYLLTVDGSLAEWFQYIKFGVIVWLINIVLRQSGERNYVGWGLFFSFLLLDDSLRIHERMGGVVARLFTFQPPMGLQLKDIGEFLVLGGAGFLLLIVLALAFFRGSQRFKRVSFDIFLLILSLAFFAVVLDLLHPLYDNQLYRLVMGTLEDAGEMFMGSVILWYVYRLMSESPNFYLHERFAFLRTLFVFDWVFDGVSPFKGIGRFLFTLISKQAALFALLAYIIYIAILTAPVLGELGITIPGDDGDAYVHLWAFEWVRDTLFSGRSPFFTTLMFFPNGTDLFSHNIPWLNILFWLPLQAIVGSAAAYSLLFLAAFVFNAFSGFWLTRALTDSKGAAFVGGLIVGGWQYTLMQFTKPNLVLLGFIPLAMWAILKLCQTGERKHVGLLTVFLAGIGLTRFQLFGLSLMLLVPWTILCLSRAVDWRQRLKRLSIAGIFSGILIAPSVFPLVWHQLNRAHPSDLFDSDQTPFIDVLAHFLPSESHPFLAQLIQPHRFDVGQIFFVGVVPMILFLIGVRYRGKQWGFWLGSVIVLFVLGLGDRLLMNGETFFSLPYHVILGTPIDGFIRDPSRFNILLGIPFGVLAGFGTKRVLAQADSVYRPLILLLLFIYITAEYQNGYRTLDLTPPVWYAELALEEGDFGILPIPHNREFSEKYLNYQRTHGKGIVEGHVSRVPREAYEFIRGVPLLDYLQENIATANMVEPPYQFANMSAQFDQFVEVDIRYLVLHKQFMHIDVVNRWREWLAVAPVHEDKEVVVYSTDLVESADSHPIINSIELVQALNTTPNKSSNQTTEFVTHWVASQHQQLPDEICLSLTISETCQPFNVEITADNQLIRTTQILMIDKLTPPDSYKVAAQFKFEGLAIGETFDLTQVDVAGVERLFARPNIVKTTDVVFGDELKLLGYDSIEQTDETLTLTLYWQALVDQSRHTKYFIHVLDKDNNIVAQLDTVPRNWAYPTTEWASEEIVADTVTIDIATIEKGAYQIVVGMVDIELDERLLLQDGNDKLPLLDTVVK